MMASLLFPFPLRRVGSVIGLMAALLLGGCATVSQPTPGDPLESFNRGVYQFNDGVDRAILKPVATAYTEITPKPVRTGVSNFFANLGEIWTFVNTLLQGNVQAAAETAMRFGVNTTFGLGGLLDVAGEAGIPKHREDFGQTLGVWGVPAGPYVVLPIFGPSTLRDTAAFPVDSRGTGEVIVIDDVSDRNALFALDLVDRRARALSATRLLDEAALDPYSFTRDAFLQRRLNDVYNGEPPEAAAVKP